MADDRIRIDSGDLYSADVDAQLEKERRMRAAALHYQSRQSAGQMTPPENQGERREYGRVATGPPSRMYAASHPREAGRSVFYSSVFYTCLAGLIMAFVAWMITEIVFEDNMDEQQIWIEGIEAQGHSLEGFALLSESEQMRILEVARSRIENRVLGNMILWFSLIGGLIGIGFGSVEGLVTRAFASAATGGLVGAVIGCIGGGVAGCVGQLFYSAALSLQTGENSLALQIVARTVGWGMAGMLMGLGQGIAMRSGKKIRNGLIAGLIGGVIGGALFDPISFVLEGAAISRMVALCVIGGLTGAMIGIVENLLKDAWLHVVAGPLKGKQFVIYKNPTIFGSSPKADIYLFKDPNIEPQHAALHVTPEGHVIEAFRTPSGTFVNGESTDQRRLRPGDMIQIGQYVFAYDEKVKQVNAMSAQI